MGILLASTSDELQVVSTDTTPLKSRADFIDYTSPSTFGPSRQNNASIVTATTTNVCSNPSGSALRNIKEFHVINTHATNSTSLTVQHTDGTNVVPFKTLTLQAGWSFHYTEKAGWYTLDQNGNDVVDNTATPGLFIKSTVVLNGTTSFVLSSRTNSIRARLQAAGGGGGGAPAVTGENGGGASAGGYAEWTVGVTPGATLTCAVGGAGTGASGAIGNAGGNTTLTVSGVTCTAFGGLGGPVGVATNAVPGAASPSVSTNGTVNCGGTPGEPSVFASTGHGGNGGSSCLGAGGLGKATAQGTGGAAGPGFGGGGGGALTSGTVQTGGAGSNGVLIIDEYT